MSPDFCLALFLGCGPIANIQVFAQEGGNMEEDFETMLAECLMKQLLEAVWDPLGTAQHSDARPRRQQI